MLTKVFYFGIGLASFIIENFNDLARAGEERYDQFVRENQPIEESIEIETSVSEETVTDGQIEMQDAPKPDDLTAINGIGPTFANRLQEAGITTYKALAGLTEDQIIEITHVAEWQGDPKAWIVSAESMA